MAIAKGREDLARGAIGARRKANEMVELFDKELEAIAETLSKTNEDLEKLQSKLKEAKAKQRSLELRHTAASTSVRINRQVHDTRIDDALSRFERYESRIDELEGQAEAWTMGQPRTLDEEFAALESEDSVNEELAAMKRRVDARRSS